MLENPLFIVTRSAIDTPLLLLSLHFSNLPSNLYTLIQTQANGIFHESTMGFCYLTATLPDSLPGPRWLDPLRGALPPNTEAVYELCALVFGLAWAWGLEKYVQ